MTRPYVPRVYAGLVHRFLWDTPRANLWAKPGAGKTVMVYTLLDMLLLAGLLRRPTLVLGPPYVVANVWPAEAALWDHFTSNLTVSAVVGTPAEREAALARDANVYTLSYENIPWLCKRLGDSKPFGCVVQDESTRTKGLRVSYQVSSTGTVFLRKEGAVRGVALAELAAHTDRWINLSGTPTPNGLPDLWGPMWFVDGGARLGRAYSAYMNRYFHQSDWKSKPVPKESAFGEIMRKTADVSLAVDPRDYYDIKKPIVTTVDLPMPLAVREQYKQMEREYYITLRGKAIQAVNAAAKSIKLLQMSSGTVWSGAGTEDDPREFHAMHDAKLDYLESLIEELNGASLLVAYWWAPDLIRLKKRFPKGRTLDKNGETEREWNAGHVPLLFVQAAAVGHGISLQHGGHHLCIYSLWWDAEPYDQIVERLGPTRQFQSGYERPVYMYYPLCSPIDRDCYNVVIEKQDLTQTLLNGMKRALS